VVPVTFLAAPSLRTGGYVLAPDGLVLVNPASIDLRIAQGLQLEPGEFSLASTVEVVHMPDDRLGFVSGKSSNAREGLLVEAAGLVDPGFRGTITLELLNMSDYTLDIREGMRICQLSVAVLDTSTDTPYPAVGHYHEQAGPTPSWYRLRQGMP
jgi:dCTP deaminase